MLRAGLILLVSANFALIRSPVALAQSAELPGPAPRKGLPRDVAHANQLCSVCHRSIAEEWNRSLHRHAYNNPYFARAVKIEPVNFCRKCHAPDANPDHDPSPALAAIGVSCLTCHWTERGAMGAHGTGGRQIVGHDTMGDVRWSDGRACANCHQFDFPAKATATLGTPMQDTVREHEISPYANTPCQRCHMPLVTAADGTRHHRHDFAVQADAAFLSRAVTLELVSRSERQVTVALSAGSIGHAFPTGDLFRSAVLELWDTSTGPTSSKRVTVRLARDYAQDRPNQSRRVASDTRLKPTVSSPDTRLITVSLAARGDTVAYRLTWIRMPDNLAKLFQLNPAMHDRVVLEGKL